MGGLSPRRPPSRWNTRLEADHLGAAHQVPAQTTFLPLAPPPGTAWFGSAWRTERVSGAGGGVRGEPGLRGPGAASPPALPETPPQGLAVTEASRGPTPEPCAPAQTVSVEFHQRRAEESMPILYTIASGEWKRSGSPSFCEASIHLDSKTRQKQYPRKGVPAVA